jgi:tRNA nucleotidyltransferase (CCA-adding enzyme)
MEIILSHNNSDFDAVASQLGAWKLYPHAIPILAVRLNRDVSEFLALYGGGFPFVAWRDAKPRNVSRIILTDTHTRPSIKGTQENTPVLIIEHHPQERPMLPHETWTGELIGATTTLLIEQIQLQHLSINPLEATLMALGIYSDTGMLTYPNTTVRDVQAVAWLLTQGARLDTIRRFLNSPLNDDQQVLYDALLKSAETRTIQGYPITICTAQADKMIDGINSVTRRVGELIDPMAIFVVVQFPRTVQLVARSSDDAINVGKVASMFEGGGHVRASAASIENTTQSEVVETLWKTLQDTVRPAHTLQELMSYGVQTLAPHELIRDILTRLRLIGHEGYPVVQNNSVIGLLTRREADRAIEHGLHQTTVREVMQAGQHTLSPSDSVSALEQLMVESGWGQIPIVNDGQLIGIVTRTDLLKHWAKTHPVQKPPHADRSVENLELTLGSSTAQLVKLIAEHAQQKRLSSYLVGGIVRDLLIGRPNRDVDFVVEGDAIEFANDLMKRYGGTVNSFKPFGTAKWYLDEKVAETMQVALSDLPRTVDFATARNEFYEHPTALPTVYSGSIKLDLARRDFTINAMAIQISPASAYGRLVDYYGGLVDLEKHKVRVLHSLSFVDDPTRILRGIRFSARYNFPFESRTAELIHTALPMLGRITGERLRNELTLLFKEDAPEKALNNIKALQVDRAVHAKFFVDEASINAIQRIKEPSPAWADEPLMLYWHVLFAPIPFADIPEIAERLLMSQVLARRIYQTAQIWQDNRLSAETTPVSELVYLLEEVQPISLQALWIFDTRAFVRERLEKYVSTWQHLQPKTDGNTLKAMGLTPSPQFAKILKRLRQAWLNAEVTTHEQETAFLDELLKEL